jgi:predicted permease|tara:strand:+ start:660 stop:977 length:318 start_codon:yes stop_codon:yes gene_type:complete
MKALSIIAVVLAGLSFFIPVVGVFSAMLASLLGLIAFRSESTLAGVAIGLNLLNTAFFSPSLLIAEAVNQSENIDSAGDLYWFYVGFHVVALVLGIILSYTKKKE